MKAEIVQIDTQLEQENITNKEAQKQLCDLFSVSGSAYADFNFNVGWNDAKETERTKLIELIKLPTRLDGVYFWEWIHKLHCH